MELSVAGSYFSIPNILHHIQGRPHFWRGVAMAVVGVAFVGGVSVMMLGVLGVRVGIVGVYV